MTELEPTPKRPFLKIVFLSPDEPRLRAGWRLAIQTILLFVFAFCAGIPISFLALIPGIDLSGGLFLALNQAVEVIAITASVFLARRFLDKRSISSLGLKFDKWTAIDILAGILITFFAMGFIYLRWGSFT